ncbi:LysR family transcriptional regulator [Paraburkholderia hospita]|uniref:LysR family transcriptional regulator n=1 Tax=Paraburkholderia hospita TaxID=169430 RepID=A0ABP2P6S4_9BURK|nr:LysR family transcriptional regulator [Paraburkholderia hospita]EIM93343.1 LysR family transcriptional regulator [Paraburkholderia hospita]OUL93000.1 LysR family transcriptional regulator [Paraburkholderia hospita]
MNQIYAMRVFVRVAETQSFRRAAQQLKVSNALVTRSIATLEAHLHARLIHRTTRNLSLTEAGTHYLEGCRGLLEELDHLEGSVAGTEREPGGTLRVVATGALSPQALTQLLDGYRRRFPKVRIRLTLAERLPHLIEDGYDVGLFIAGPTPAGASADTDSIELSFATQRLVPCAAPSYLAAREEPHHPNHLALHSCIATPSEQRGPTVWHFIESDGDAQPVTLDPSYMVNSPLLVRLAAIAGMGVAVLPEPLVADDFATGALKRIMQDYTVDESQAKVSLVYPRRRHLPAKTRAFVDYTLEHASCPASALSARAHAIIAHDLHPAAQHAS